MAALNWLQTWDGSQLDWQLTWAEGDAFELSAPPSLTFVATFGIGGDFNFRRELVGAAVASAVGSGTIEQTGPMAGAAIASAVAAGTLTTGVLLSGQATARAQALATLLAADLISGDAVASAMGVADLTVLPPEAGVPIGISRRPIGRPRAVAGTFGRIGRGRA